MIRRLGFLASEDWLRKLKIFSRRRFSGKPLVAPSNFGRVIIFNKLHSLGGSRGQNKTIGMIAKANRIQLGKRNNFQIVAAI